MKWSNSNRQQQQHSRGRVPPANASYDESAMMYTTATPKKSNTTTSRGHSPAHQPPGHSFRRPPSNHQYDRNNIFGGGGGDGTGSSFLEGHNLLHQQHHHGSSSPRLTRIHPQYHQSPHQQYRTEARFPLKHPDPSDSSSQISLLDQDDSGDDATRDGAGSDDLSSIGDSDKAVETSSVSSLFKNIVLSKMPPSTKSREPKVDVLPPAEIKPSHSAERRHQRVFHQKQTQPPTSLGQKASPALEQVVQEVVEEREHASQASSSTTTTRHEEQGSRASSSAASSMIRVPSLGGRGKKAQHSSQDSNGSTSKKKGFRSRNLFSKQTRKSKKEANHVSHYGGSSSRNHHHPADPYAPQVHSHQQQNQAFPRLTWRMDPEKSLSDWEIRIQHKESASFVDVYHVHRMVLAVGPRRSEHFSNLFASRNSISPAKATSKKNYTKMEMSRAAAMTFPVVLDYMYGSHNTDDALLGDLTNASAALHVYHHAEYFLISGLKPLVAQWFARHVKLREIPALWEQSLQFASADPLQQVMMDRCATHLDEMDRELDAPLPPTLLLETLKRVAAANKEGSMVYPFESRTEYIGKLIVDSLEDASNEDEEEESVGSHSKRRSSSSMFEQLTSKTFLPKIASPRLALKLLLLDSEQQKKHHQQDDDASSLTCLQKRCVKSIAAHWDHRWTHEFDGHRQSLVDCLAKLSPRLLAEILSRQAVLKWPPV